MELRLTVGQPARPSKWVQVTQPLISAFAEVTGDDAFIHVDPPRAAESRFGGTIAHGLLTLSLLPKLLRSAAPALAGARMGVNYGFDRVRFLAPVRVDSRIRAVVGLAALVEKKPGFYLLTYDVTVELDGGSRPAATARWLLGRWMT